MSAETLLCDPVLRHGWDGIFRITICDFKIGHKITKFYPYMQILSKEKRNWECILYEVRKNRAGYYPAKWTKLGGAGYYPEKRTKH